MFNTLDWFYGSGWPGMSSFMQPMGAIFIFTLIATGALALLAWARGARHGVGRDFRHHMSQ